MPYENFPFDFTCEVELSQVKFQNSKREKNISLVKLAFTSKLLISNVKKYEISQNEIQNVK